MLEMYVYVSRTHIRVVGVSRCAVRDNNYGSNCSVQTALIRYFVAALCAINVFFFFKFKIVKYSCFRTFFKNHTLEIDIE